MTADELKRLRKRIGWTQNQLATAVGVYQVTVARWETGARGISEPVARLILRLAADARKEGKRR